MTALAGVLVLRDLALLCASLVVSAAAVFTWRGLVVVGLLCVLLLLGGCAAVEWRVLECGRSGAHFDRERCNDLEHVMAGGEVGALRRGSGSLPGDGLPCSVTLRVYGARVQRPECGPWLGEPGL